MATLLEMADRFLGEDEITEVSHEEHEAVETPEEEHLEQLNGDVDESADEWVPDTSSEDKFVVDRLVDKIFKDELEQPIKNTLDKALKELQRTVGKTLMNGAKEKINSYSVERHLDREDEKTIGEVKKKLDNKVLQFLISKLSA